MFCALGWFVVFGLLALWSLAAWGFHSLAAWAVSNAGVLVGASGTASAVRLPDWLATWIPPGSALAFSSMLAAFTGGPAATG